MAPRLSPARQRSQRSPTRSRQPAAGALPAPVGDAAVRVRDPRHSRACRFLLLVVIVMASLLFAQRHGLAAPHAKTPELLYHDHGRL
eukprot:3772219-Prymnesium_polylepis.1